MKRLLAFLLVLIMLLPAIVSCGEEEAPADESSSTKQEETSTKAPDETTTKAPDETSTKAPDETSTKEPDQTTTEPVEDTTTESGEDTTTDTGDDITSTDPVIPEDPIYSTKNDPNDKWSGETLNVLCTRYGNTAGAPWGQVELNPVAYGESFKTAQEDRSAKILEMYGVTVNWVEAQMNQSIIDDLNEAANAENVTYELGIPRAFEVQALSTVVFNMGDSEYIDFRNSYYSQVAYECMTVAGVTLFAAGDFSFQDEQLAYMIYYNKEILQGLNDSIDLYKLVETGKWTYSMMANLARGVSGDVNGNHEQDDEDKYGFATKSVARFYQYFGIAEASVIDGMYQLTLNAPNVTEVVSKIIEVNTGSDWCRANWGRSESGGSNMGVAFLDGRILFYNDASQSADNWNDIEFEIGVLPFPKLNNDQEDYCAPVNNAQPTFLCIPKVTGDREMSEFFVDVLMWTGSDYIMKTYYENFELKLSSDYENDLRILKDHIHSNIFYDVGEITSGWAGLLGTVRSNAHADNKDSFNALYLENEGTAQTTIDAWNMNWAAYDDEA
ncbi:MAG: hypothetical protein J6B60_03860 [Clostridia bacterium]|nr:hypothetical protein [Clostridia bacterium]